jgi:hypothetical protein
MFHIQKYLSNYSIYLLTPTCLLSFLILVGETAVKSQDQEYFTLIFPKPPMLGKKERSRPSELQITVPVSVEKRSFLN